MSRCRRRICALALGFASGCVGVEEIFLPLGDEVGGAQWILIEGEGATARASKFEPGSSVFRTPENARLRALVYDAEVFPDPVPTLSTKGSPLPTPLSLLELVPEGDGYGWRAGAFSALELRIEESSPCGRIESEAIVTLPLSEPEDLFKSSVVLRDGRILVGGEEHLFVIQDREAVRSTWTSSSGPRGGPRSLSEGPDGLWFEASGEVYFAVLQAGAPIRPTLRSILAPGAADFVHAQPDQLRLILIDQAGELYERTEARGLHRLESWGVNGKASFLGPTQLVLIQEGDPDEQTLARFGRYDDGVLTEEAPFGEDATQRVFGVVFGRDYIKRGDGGRLTLDRGDGWQRFDLPTDRLGRIRSVAQTARGFLVGGPTVGQILEYVWGYGYCPPASFQGVGIERLHGLGGDRYVVVPERLADGVRFFRLLPP